LLKNNFHRIFTLTRQLDNEELSLENPFAAPGCLFPLLGGNKQLAEGASLAEPASSRHRLVDDTSRRSRHVSKRRLRSSPVGQAATLAPHASAGVDRFGDMSHQTRLFRRHESPSVEAASSRHRSLWRHESPKTATSTPRGVDARLFRYFWPSASLLLPRLVATTHRIAHRGGPVQNRITF